jgi:hypothetical protein
LIHLLFPEASPRYGLDRGTGCFFLDKDSEFLRTDPVLILIFCLLRYLPMLFLYGFKEQGDRVFYL